MIDNSLFPVLVYEYNSQGRYGEPVRMTEPRLVLWMTANLKKILREKRELRITDTGDLLCFHVQDGKILYDGQTHYPNGKPLPEGALDEPPSKN